MSEPNLVTEASKEDDTAFYQWLTTNYGFPTNIDWDRVPQAIREKKEEYDASNHKVEVKYNV